MKLVTVVIPIYNDGLYLIQALNSALNQTYRNIEVIIVNDGSTDPYTLQVLSGISDARVLIIDKQNDHLAAARNTGIKVAKGEYILTLDSDDYFELNFLEKAVNILEANIEVGVVSCYMKSFGLHRKRWKPVGGGFENTLVENICCASALFRRECWVQIQGYDEKMKKGLEDWDFWMRITAEGWNVKIINEYLLNYRVKPTSMFINDTLPYKKEILKYMFSKHPEKISEYLSNRIGNYKLIDMDRKISFRRSISLILKLAKKAL